MRSRSESDDGSMFETLADFFSVIALAAIVSVMMYGASLQPGSQSADVVVSAGAGPAELEARQRLAVFLTEAGDTPRAEIRDTATLLAVVSLSLAADESRTTSITNVADLVQQLSGSGPVAIECVLDEARSDALAAVFANLLSALQRSGRPCAALGVF